MRSSSSSRSSWCSTSSRSLVSTVRPEPSGATGSAYATQPRGAAAYAEVLRRAGHDVSYLRAPLGDAQLDPASTLIVLDAPALEPRRALGAAALRARRRAARRRRARTRAATSSTARPAWRPAGPQRGAARRARARDARGAHRAQLGRGRLLLERRRHGFGARRRRRWSSWRSRRPAAAARCCSPMPRRCRTACSAKPTTRRSGSRSRGRRTRPVTFVESVHGFGRSSGLAALPGRWKFALLVGVLAALLWLGSRARRFGPPEPTRRRGRATAARARRGARDRAAPRAPAGGRARAGAGRGARAGHPPRGARARCGRGGPCATPRCGSASRRMRSPRCVGERGPMTTPLALGRALSRGRR